MLRFLKSNGFKLFLAVIAVLMSGSALALVTGENSSPFASAAAVVFGPVQRLSAKAANGMSGLSISFKSSSYYRKTSEELESELAGCRESLAGYDKALKKLELYENFLEIKEENPDYTFVSASIIARGAEDLYCSFTLNKGTVHGISINNPVIYNKYLVGVVTSVMATQCNVDTILNPKVNISAYETRTRESGYIETDSSMSKNGLCRLSGIERTTQIAPGGMVCTSGTGGIYPKDLLIGEVEEIADATENISAYAAVRPYVDYSKLIDLFIITGFSE
ncbi:MAG: rod shape-determining protein MreC [Clostridiales bacterium]|jgi:rod shape-determining protein MreC|nr:rod shape-determining protein MreC [Clostridiales bacterium]